MTQKQRIITVNEILPTFAWSSILPMLISFREAAAAALALIAFPFLKHRGNYSTL
jgi:hypothetical protein